MYWCANSIDRGQIGCTRLAVGTQECAELHELPQALAASGTDAASLATPLSRAKRLSWAESGLTLQAFPAGLPCLHRGLLRVNTECSGPLTQSANSACIHQSLTHEALLVGHTRMKWLEPDRWTPPERRTPSHPCRIGCSTLGQLGLRRSEFHCQVRNPNRGSRREQLSQKKPQTPDPREVDLGQAPSSG